MVAVDERSTLFVYICYWRCDKDYYQHSWIVILESFIGCFYAD
jgi:hypothetical protein